MKIDNRTALGDWLLSLQYLCPNPGDRGRAGVLTYHVFVSLKVQIRLGEELVSRPH